LGNVEWKGKGKGNQHIDKQGKIWIGRNELSSMNAYRKQKTSIKPNFNVACDHEKKLQQYVEAQN